jgi:drug/metabolite transporter (DMT)-like permease
MASAHGALPVLGGATILGAAWMAPAAAAELALRGASLADVPWRAWAAISFLGVGCSFLATLLWFRALETTGAQEVGVWLYTIPPMTITAAGVFLHEPVGWGLVGGAALVLAGVRLTEGVSPSQRPPGPAPAEPPGPPPPRPEG